MDNTIKIGDFQFSFDGKDDVGILKFRVNLGSRSLLLYDVLNNGNPKTVLEYIKKDIWIDEFDTSLEISFEESTFSFLKLDMPQNGWDGEYDEELPIINILVRYTDPWTNNIATLSNIEEIELFNEWYNLFSNSSKI